MSRDSMRDPVPVSLLAGFLGSGKTTLLNRVLTGPGGAGIAVVVNEFGAAGIDGRLVTRRDEEVVELANGCICCELRGDLREALLGLAARRRRRLRRARFDRVVVEASGLAAPGPAVQTFLVDGDLAETYALGAVVTLAHAALVEEQVAAHPEAEAQLAYADRVLLNHADRADEATLARAEALVRARTPLAEVLRTVRALPLAPAGGPAGAGEQGAAVDLLVAPAGPRAHASPAPVAVGHTEGVGAVVLESELPRQRAALEIWLRFLGQRRSHELMRVKGVVHTDAGPLVVQGVHQWLELAPADPAVAEGASRLVLIGRNLDRAELERGWAAAGG